MLFCVWSASGGGFEETTWYPGALLVLALLGLGLVMTRGSRRPHPLALAALALLGCFVVWSFASIGWAEVKGDAWDGANRSLLYLTVFALFALPAWRPASAAIVLGAFALGVAVLGGATLIQIASASEPALAFLKGALIDPTGYHNSTAAPFPPAAIRSHSLRLTARDAVAAAGPVPRRRGDLRRAHDPRPEPRRRDRRPARPDRLLRARAGPGASAVRLLPRCRGDRARAAGPLLDVYPAAKDGIGLAAAIDDAISSVWLGVLVVVALRDGDRGR